MRPLEIVGRWRNFAQLGIEGVDLTQEGAHGLSEALPPLPRASRHRTAAIVEVRLPGGWLPSCRNIQAREFAL
jgi:hypothetical protein